MVVVFRKEQGKEDHDGHDPQWRIPGKDPGNDIGHKRSQDVHQKGILAQHHQVAGRKAQNVRVERILAQSPIRKKTAGG